MYTFKEKNAEYIDNISKVIDIMNSTNELFLKSELENVINVLSDPVFGEIKQAYKKPINLFKKRSHKLETSNLSNAFELRDNTKFKITFDVEHSLYVINENDSERILAFVDMTHLGKISNDYYFSLIKSVNPSVVFLEHEPFEEFELNKKQLLDEINFVNQHKCFIRSIDKDKLSDNVNRILQDKSIYDVRENYVFKRSRGMTNNIIKKGEYIITENESILNYIKNYCPPKLNKIIFNELTTCEYINSFINSEYKLEENKLKELTHLLQNLEIVNWLLLQEKVGCKKCASFFNKQIVNWQPLNIEYLIDKSLLNNYEYTLNKQTDNILNEYNNNSNENMIVFSSDALALCRNFMKKSDSAEEIKIYKTIDNVIIDKENIDKIVFSLYLKENFQNYFFNLPFQTEVNRVKLLEQFFKSFNKSAKENITWKKNFRGINDVDWINSSCYPTQYLRNSLLINEKMDNFIKEKEFLI